MNIVVVTYVPAARERLHASGVAAGTRFFCATAAL